MEIFHTSPPHVSRRFKGDVPFSAREVLDIANLLRTPVERIFDRARLFAEDRAAESLRAAS